MLEYVKVASEVGAVGILAVILYLFATGRIMSEPSVKKLMDAQANHMGDLQKTIADLKTGIVTRLDNMVGVLEEIKKNGAMNRKK